MKKTPSGPGRCVLSGMYIYYHVHSGVPNFSIFALSGNNRNLFLGVCTRIKDRLLKIITAEWISNKNFLKLHKILNINEVWQKKFSGRSYCINAWKRNCWNHTYVKCKSGQGKLSEYALIRQVAKSDFPPWLIQISRWNLEYIKQGSGWTTS